MGNRLMGLKWKADAPKPRDIAPVVVVVQAGLTIEVLAD